MFGVANILRKNPVVVLDFIADANLKLLIVLKWEVGICFGHAIRIIVRVRMQLNSTFQKQRP